MITERIHTLRAIMQREGWDAVIVPGSDPHNSEYTPARWEQRRFISGFTGSYGTVCITQDHAGLWTDTRYFIQATQQLQGTGIELHKLRVQDAVDVPEWLATTAAGRGTVCIDGSCMSVSEVEHLQEVLGTVGGTVVSRPDFIDELWEDRPGLPDDKIFVLPTEYSGRSTADKLRWLRSRLDDEGCDSILLSSLDEIAWLLNIRSHDIDFTPVVIAYALVERQRTTLFVLPSKISEEYRTLCEDLMFDGEELITLPYDTIAEQLRQRADTLGRLMIDTRSLNYDLYSSLQYLAAPSSSDCQSSIINGPSSIVHCQLSIVNCQLSPVRLEKALKNDTELNGYRRAFLKDGIAQTKLFKWIEESLQAGVGISEMDVADKLVALRREQGGYLDESFAPISAYGSNAALPHYEPTHEQCSLLEPHGLYLLDSGAHYLDGTTDITRTIPLGPLTALEREDYTLVLKGMIGLATVLFPRGTRGANIDVLARIPLWRAARNFGHGTGHGIGHVLCVHEGPQDLRQNLYDQPMLPGMVTSDEPGIYREGQHGIRHENVILCREVEQNEFGDWLGFETLTCTYIDVTPLEPSLLTADERDWINAYNRSVYMRLLPFLDEEEKLWLRSKTINREL